MNTLDETSTIADFQTGKTYYYTGDAPIVYDYDLLPDPTPVPVSGFNFVNLSVHTVTFNSWWGNFTYNLTPNQSLRDVQVVDNWWVWEAVAVEYIDNISDLQEATTKWSVTTNAIIVRNNPDTYRTRYSTIWQEIQKDDLGYRVVNSHLSLRKSTIADSKTWEMQYPDLTGNPNNTSFVVSFRPNVSGTVAYLSDIPAGKVQFYTDTSFFPVTGSADVIYVSKDTNELYIWSTINVAYELLSVGTLQQVTSIGNSTSNDIQLNWSQLRLSNFFTNAILRANPSNENLDIWSNANAFFASLSKQALTQNRTFSFPDNTGTFTLTSDLGISQYKRKSFYFEEFQGNGSGTGWVSSVSGGAWGQAQLTSNTELGVMRAGTGNAALGSQRGAAHTGQPATNGQVVLWNGTYKIGFRAGMGGTLYSGSLSGSLFLGLSKSIVPTSRASVIFRSENGGNWQCITHNDTTQTLTNTSVPVLANTYNKFEIEINSDATEVKFWIDGVLVATHTTNIPTVSLSHIISNNRISATAVDVGFFIDWFYYDKTWLADRF